MNGCKVAYIFKDRCLETVKRYIAMLSFPQTFQTCSVYMLKLGAGRYSEEGLHPNSAGTY